MSTGVRIIVAACVALLSGVAHGQAVGVAPIKTTLCELAKESSRFNGRTVEVRERVGRSEGVLVLFDHACSAYIQLAVADRSLRQRGGENELGNLLAVLKKQPSVTAKLTGRFEQASSRKFGQHMFDCRMLMQSATDIIATKTDGSIRQEGTLKGAVVDGTCALIVGATVQLYRSGQKKTVTGTRTDATGAFYFPAIEPDTYDAVIDASGFKSKRITRISVSNAAEVQLPPVKLELSGIVFDADHP